nr:hypothetical protein [Bacteroidota bacterium]
MKNKLFFIAIVTFTYLLNYAPASAQNIPDFLVNEYVGMNCSEQSNPSIDGDGFGNFVVCWMDERNGWDFDIYAQIFLGDTTTTGINIMVNDDAGGVSQYRPVIAVDPNMNFVITWLDRRNGFTWDVYAQRFSNDGTALGSNFKVNVEPGNEEQEQPTVSMDNSGNFVIVWADEKSGDFDIWGQRYAADGTALGENFKINDDNGNELQYWPTSNCDKDGNFIVSWVDQQSQDDYNIYAQRFSSDGTAMGNNVMVNTDVGISIKLRPDIMIDEVGNYIIAWEGHRNGDWDIYAQRYSEDGTPQGDNFNLNENTLESDQRNVSVSCDLEGNFVASWE